MDKKLADKGVLIGDTLIVQPTGERLTVRGFTTGQTYTHTPVIYANLAQWQTLRFAAPGSAGQVQNPISVITVKASKEAANQIPGAIAGTEIASRSATVNKLPGYSEESGSVLMIQGFLFVIAAFILAAFFYVLTLQKTAQFGILKAIGARTTFLARDLIAQVVILTISGIIAGAALTHAVAAVTPSAVPFALSNALVLGYGLILLVVALLGTLLSLWQIGKIDPLIAIGRID